MLKPFASWPPTIGPWILNPGVWCVYRYFPLPSSLSSNRPVSPAASLPSPCSTMYCPPPSSLHTRFTPLWRMVWSATVLQQSTGQVAHPAKNSKCFKGYSDTPSKHCTPVLSPASRSFSLSLPPIAPTPHLNSSATFAYGPKPTPSLQSTRSHGTRCVGRCSSVV
jgi:hypothetical protein